MGKLAVLGVLCLLVSEGARAEGLHVYAAASLTDALSEAAKRFEAKEGGKATLVFGASSDLARQIQAGAPADVFVSADEAKVDALQKAGLAGERVALLSNQLAVVVPKDSPRTVSSARELTQVRRLALADPAAVPAGIYARKWLESQGVWEAVKAKVLPALDVRAALAAVESEAADAGIVYRTDAAISKKVRVAYEVPPGQGPAIVYPAVVLAKARSPLASKFLAFLQGDEARTVFEKYGFRFLPARK